MGRCSYQIIVEGREDGIVSATAFSGASASGGANSGDSM